MEGGEVRKAGLEGGGAVRLKKRSENVNDSHRGEKKMMNGKLGDRGERSGKEEER